MKELVFFLEENNMKVLKKLIEEYETNKNYKYHISLNTLSRKRIIKTDMELNDSELMVITLKELLEEIKENILMDIIDNNDIETIELKLNLNTIEYIIKSDLIDCIEDNIKLMV